MNLHGLEFAIVSIALRFSLLLILASALSAADVVVVGAGVAGLTTALEAARGGAQVTVVDIASVWGGHAVVSEGGLNLTATPLQAKLGAKDSTELAYQDFLRWGEDANAEWVKIYVNRSRPDIHDWLVGMGVEFNGLRLLAGNSVARFHDNPRRGYGIVEPIYRRCLETGRVTFVWNTRVKELLREKGRVTGVAGVNERTGEAWRLEAKAVVIATGGFQSNLELVRKHWPAGVPVPEKILVGAGVNALGSGFDLVAPVGGALERLDHQWNYPRGIPDPRYPGLDRALNLNAYAVIWVNARGERFVNESAGSAAILKAMLEQPQGRAWIVFDAEGRKSVSPSGTDWRDPAKVERLLLENPAIGQKAATLDELAQKAGFPKVRFLAAIERLNQALAVSEDREFGRFSKENPPVALPGRPALLPIVKAPFYAVPMYPMTRKSMGGIAVDLECRVLNAKRQPIAGLYAAGEATGFAGLNGKAGLEGTFIGPSILQGRRLGASLAKLATSSPAIAQTAATAGPVVEAPCQTCHNVAKLVATPRKGYWHFERSHRTVMERQWDCAGCHAEMKPFRAGAHRIDRVKQINACARCHLGAE